MPASQKNVGTSCDGAFRVITVTAQIAKVDAAPQCEDGAEHEGKELALRSTHRRHLLQDIVDNGHGHAPGKVLSTHIQPVHGQSCEPPLQNNVQSIELEVPPNFWCLAQ